MGVCLNQEPYLERLGGRRCPGGGAAGDEERWRGALAGCGSGPRWCGSDGGEQRAEAERVRRRHRGRWPAPVATPSALDTRDGSKLGRE